MLLNSLSFLQNLTTCRDNNAIRMSAADMSRSVFFLTFSSRCATCLRSFHRFVHFVYSPLGEVLWAACTVWVGGLMGWEEFPELVFSVWYVNVCVHVFFLSFFFMGGSGVGQAFWRGPDSCLLLPQGVINREGGVVIYPFLSGQEAEEETLLGSHCNYTQLQGKKWSEEEIGCLKGAVSASLNPSLRNPSLSSFYLLYNCVVGGWDPGSSIFLSSPFSVLSSPFSVSRSLNSLTPC